MTDIFISYASADREKVRPFAKALEKKGWQVWWDRQMRSGTAFDRIIEQALDEAQCVIVIWSRSSVESDWVRAEAGDGFDRGILISIAIEQELRVPLRFRNVHTDLIIDLSMDQAPSVFRKILEDIRALSKGSMSDGAPTKVEANQKAELIERVEQELSEPAKSFKNSIGMEFILIPSGSFTMGSSTYTVDARPPHEVKISQSFYLQTTQVTQDQWKGVMGDNPSNFKDCGADCPVELVSWEDAKEFIRKLNKKEGIDKYRLPTEAEWEYACYAETLEEFDLRQLQEYAWYNKNSEDKTHPVGQKNQTAGDSSTCTATSGNGWKMTITIITKASRMTGGPGQMNPGARNALFAAAAGTLLRVAACRRIAAAHRPAFATPV